MNKIPFKVSWTTIVFIGLLSIVAIFTTGRAAVVVIPILFALLLINGLFVGYNEKKYAQNGRQQ